MLMLLSAVSLRILGRDDDDNRLVVVIFGIADFLLLVGVIATRGEQILSMIGG